MKIVFTSDRAYARAIKVSEVLLDRGHEIIFLTGVMDSYPVAYMEMGQKVSFGTEVEYIKQLSRIKGIDLIVAQNFPSWHGLVAKKVYPDTPLIFDIQDSARCLFSQPEISEDDVIKVADGVTLLGEFYLDAIPEVKHKLNHVFYSCMPKRQVPKDNKPQIDGILYEGAVNGKHEEDSPWGWRDFRSVCATLADAAIPVFMQMPDQKYADEYIFYGATPLYPTCGAKLIEEMTAYTWGICGYDDLKKGEVQKQGYLPNKLFEYIAAGIPTISYNTGAVGEFVEKHNIGAVAKTKDDIIRIFKDKDLQKRLQKNVRKARLDLTMEAQMDDILAFFETVIRSVKEKKNGGEQDLSVSGDVSRDTEG